MIAKANNMADATRLNRLTTALFEKILHIGRINPPIIKMNATNNSRKKGMIKSVAPSLLAQLMRVENKNISSRGKNFL